MSTGDNQRLGVPNSRVMVEYAVGLGILRESLIEEDRSLSTLGECLPTEPSLIANVCQDWLCLVC